MLCVPRILAAGVAAVLLSECTSSPGDDWTRFRGPNGTGISHDAGVPLKWSDSENLRWKVQLPGFGSSSPIVVGKRVFVTSYAGPGTGGRQGGREELKRQLVCVGREQGETLWTQTVDAELPEDEFGGYLTEHGYASNTPTSDGERVYAFFGKAGVHAHDLGGKPLWSVNVGKESSSRRWGSAASLLLYKDMLIVNAAEESNSIRALDKRTGRPLWKVEANMLELAYGTPALISKTTGNAELVIAVPGELWALDPDHRGKLLWRAETKLGGNVCPSPLVEGDTIYIFGGIRSSGSHAFKAGGKGDVSQSHLLWTTRNSSYVATPLLFDKRLYWVDDHGVAWCINASDGSIVYRTRVPGLQTGGRPVYASPVLAVDKIIVVTRWDGILAIEPRPEFKLLAQNRFAGDDSDFNSTPALSDGELFVRSNRMLYCVSSRK